MRILVVEDEPRLLHNLAKALREAGYAVDTADNGDDGLFKAESYEYDAVVLDVMLPKLDGWQLLERLRARKRTPVLMLTARDTTRDRVRGLDAGADDYLAKPFDLSELLARIRALIRRAAGQARSSIVIRDLVIDTRARRVTRNSDELALTAREYGILESLILLDAYDQDNDGALSSTELAAAVTSLVTRLQTNFLGKYDTNKDGAVSSAEALAVSQSIVDAEIQSFLNTYDTNKDGSVTRAEIIAVRQAAGATGDFGPAGGHR